MNWKKFFQPIRELQYPSATKKSPLRSTATSAGWQK